MQDDSGFDQIDLSAVDYKTGWLEAYQAVDTGSLWQEEPAPCLPEVISVLVESGCDTVLELGAGDGRNTVGLLRSALNVTTLDLSPQALVRCRDRCRVAGLRPAAMVTSDIDALPHPFVSETYDAVVVLDVIGQIAPLDQVLSALKMLLRSGGLLAANFYSLEDAAFGVGDELAPHTFLYRDTLFRFFDEDDIEHLLSGWEIVSISRREWVDPPHPGFRETEHTHVNYVVVARSVDSEPSDSE